MRKKGFILVIIGAIIFLIGISMLLVEKYNGKNNNSKANQNQNVIINDNNEYNPISYKKISINQKNNLFYSVPKGAYLSKIKNNYIEYKNDDILILRYINYRSNDEIMAMINSNADPDNHVDISTTELENGNILIVSKETSNGYYAEQLNFLIKVFDNYSYYVYYRIENMSFSDKFIKEITNINEKNDNNNIVNQDGKWHFDLYLKNKKEFELDYDSSKYSTLDYYQDYTYVLTVPETSNEQITLYYLYDELGVDASINTTYKINSTEKLKLKKYDAWLYMTVSSDNTEYIEYLIKIDDYTKLRIRYPKSIESKVDVNDLLNFVYK
jgi:hypothetical protein